MRPLLRWMKNTVTPNPSKNSSDGEERLSVFLAFVHLQDGDNLWFVQSDKGFEKYLNRSIDPTNLDKSFNDGVRQEFCQTMRERGYGSGEFAFAPRAWFPHDDGRIFDMDRVTSIFNRAREEQGAKTVHIMEPSTRVVTINLVKKYVEMNPSAAPYYKAFCKTNCSHVAVDPDNGEYVGLNGSREVWTFSGERLWPDNQPAISAKPQTLSFIRQLT